MQFCGELMDLEFGLNEIQNYFDLSLSEPVKVVQLEESSEVCLKISHGVENVIAYKAKHHFFRAVGLYMQFIKEGQASFTYEEKSYIPVCGAMFDVSRNSVYKVEKLKQILVDLALMGHSTCMLYSEDTYTIPEYPYFGYMRGRYTQEELRTLDDYAYNLGIELVPCIQTLAHLKNTLRWNYAQNFKDTNDVLLVGAPETYTFLDHMFKAIRSTFRTNRIHIGMDEAWDLGLGRSIEVNGYKHHQELMSIHLKEVCALLNKYNFEPMMWDDMFLRAAAPNSDHYNLNVQIDPEVIESIPENMSLVYWDYYHSQEDFYNKAINLRNQFKKPVIFAGGVWKWVGFAPNYQRTFLTTNAALTTCKAQGIREVFATMWGDDGDEAPIDTSILGLIYFAEHCFMDKVDEAWMDRRCQFFTGLTLEELRSPEELDLIPGVPQPNLGSCNPSKQFLYQDILLGAFDFYAQDPGLRKHYCLLVDRYRAIARKNTRFSHMFNLYAELATVLVTKSVVGFEIREAYLEKDRETLELFAEDILETLIMEVLDLIDALRKLWYKDCKGHGFEILDVRLSGIIGRIKTTMYRLTSYLNGEIDCIEELEEERLPFHLGWQSGDEMQSVNQYMFIGSQNVFSHGI